MNEQQQSTQPVPPVPVRRRSRRVLAGAALATGLAVGGAGVAAALSNSSTAIGATGASVPDALLADVGGTAPGPGMGHRMGHGLRGALHGELTVPQADGTGTRVVLVQRGAVTAVSGSRLSVKSSDGFTATYPVSASTKVRCGTGTTISAIKVGATVHVVASKGGAALMVVDEAAGPMGGRWRHDHDHDGDRDDAPTTGTPTPAPTSGASFGAVGTVSEL